MTNLFLQSQIIKQIFPLSRELLLGYLAANGFEMPNGLTKKPPFRAVF